MHKFASKSFSCLRAVWTIANNTGRFHVCAMSSGCSAYVLCATIQKSFHVQKFPNETLWLDLFIAHEVTSKLIWKSTIVFLLGRCGFRLNWAVTIWPELVQLEFCGSQCTAQTKTRSRQTWSSGKIWCENFSWDSVFEFSWKWEECVSASASTSSRNSVIVPLRLFSLPMWMAKITGLRVCQNFL